MGAIFHLVVPVMMALNNYCSVTVMVVPPAMETAVMRVELGTGVAIVVTIAIVGVTVAANADAHAKTLGARNSRRRNSDGGQRG